MKNNKRLTRMTRFPSNQWHHWSITKTQAGSSLLAFLSDQLSSIPSKRSLKRVLENNTCYLNGSIERFANRKLNVYDEVHFSKQALTNQKENPPTILFEDDAILVIEKPTGISSEHLVEHFPSTNLVHRLDKPTSGIMILAKSSESQENILLQFRKKQVQKTYLALVHGKIFKEKGVIRSHLEKKFHFEGQTIWGSTSKKRGRYAVTEFQKLDVGQNSTLLQIKPITGKTHQIRVHMKEMSHPILGDAQYAKDIHMDPSQELMLHSYQISFHHPITQKPLFFETKMPSRFLSKLSQFFTQKQKKNSRNCSDKYKDRKKIEQAF